MVLLAVVYLGGKIMKTTAKVLPCNEVNFDRKYRTIPFIYLDGLLEGLADIPMISEEVYDDSLYNIMHNLKDNESAEVELIVTVKNKPIESLALVWKPSGTDPRGLICAINDIETINIVREKKKSFSRYL